MNEQDYMDLQITMATIFRQIKVLPLDETIDTLNMALTVGPFIDPTLWIKKQSDGERFLRLLTAFRICRDSIAKEFEVKKDD